MLQMLKLIVVVFTLFYKLRIYLIQKCLCVCGGVNRAQAWRMWKIYSMLDAGRLRAAMLETFVVVVWFLFHLFTK